VSRQPGRGDQGDPPDDVDAEAVATRSAIARLRWQLRWTFHDPMVRGEWRKLEEDVAAMYEQDTPSPGRHRASSAPDERDGQQAAEPGGIDLKLDPATAQTGRDLIEILVHYKTRSGLSWREIAARARQKRVHSTLCEAMHRSVLPTREVVEAIITGCGGSQDDLDASIAAWQRINATSTTRSTGEFGEPEHIAGDADAATGRPLSTA
jgi:hypothetical protein